MRWRADDVRLSGARSRGTSHSTVVVRGDANRGRTKSSGGGETEGRGKWKGESELKDQLLCLQMRLSCSEWRLRGRNIYLRSYKVWKYQIPLEPRGASKPVGELTCRWYQYPDRISSASQFAGWQSRTKGGHSVH